MLHRHTDQAVARPRGRGAEDQRVVDTMEHGVVALDPHCDGDANDVLADRQQRHLKAELGLEALPGRNGDRLFDGRQVGIVGEQHLTQPVLDLETDDRRREVPVGGDIDDQAHELGADDPGQFIAVIILERDILDSCAADAEARAVQVKIRDLQIVAPRAAVEKIETWVPDGARRPHIGEMAEPRLRQKRRRRSGRRLRNEGVGGARRRFELIQITLRNRQRARRQVGIGDILGGADRPDPAMLEPHRFLAQPDHIADRVRDEQKRAAAQKIADMRHAFLYKERVADRERLVGDHDVGVDMGDDRKSEASHHAARIDLDWLVDKVADLREVDYRLKAPIDFFTCQPKDRSFQIDVFAASEFSIQTRRIIEDHDFPVNFDRTARRAQIAGDDLEQGRFAAAIDADKAPALALANLERDIFKGVEFAI